MKNCDKVFVANEGDEIDERILRNKLYTDGSCCLWGKLNHFPACMFFSGEWQQVYRPG